MQALLYIVIWLRLLKQHLTKPYEKNSQVVPFDLIKILVCMKNGKRAMSAMKKENLFLINPVWSQGSYLGEHALWTSFLEPFKERLEFNLNISHNNDLENLCTGTLYSSNTLYDQTSVGTWPSHQFVGLPEIIGTKVSNHVPAW